MKTSKLYSILSLALIFLVTTGYAKKGPDRIPDSRSKSQIRYEVNIHNLKAANLCNTYQVQVTDANGRLVASPTTFVPGISKYTFFEEGPAYGRIRIATLVLSPNNDRYICQTTFTLRPAVLWAPFLGGSTYIFNLYPVVQEGSHDSNNE